MAFYYKEGSSYTHFSDDSRARGLYRVGTHNGLPVYGKKSEVPTTQVVHTPTNLPSGTSGTVTQKIEQTYGAVTPIKKTVKARVEASPESVPTKVTTSMKVTGGAGTLSPTKVTQPTNMTATVGSTNLTQRPDESNTEFQDQVQEVKTAQLNVKSMEAQRDYDVKQIDESKTYVTSDGREVSGKQLKKEITNQYNTAIKANKEAIKSYATQRSLELRPQLELQRGTKSGGSLTGVVYDALENQSLFDRDAVAGVMGFGESLARGVTTTVVRGAGSTQKANIYPSMTPSKVIETEWKDPKTLVESRPLAKQTSALAEGGFYLASAVSMGNALETSYNLKNLKVSDTSTVYKPTKSGFKTTSTADISNAFPLTDYNVYQIRANSLTKVTRLTNQASLMGTRGTTSLVRVSPLGTTKVLSSEPFATALLVGGKRTPLTVGDELVGYSTDYLGFGYQGVGKKYLDGTYYDFEPLTSAGRIVEPLSPAKVSTSKGSFDVIGLGGSGTATKSMVSKDLAVGLKDYKIGTDSLKINDYFRKAPKSGFSSSPIYGKATSKVVSQAQTKALSGVATSSTKGLMTGLAGKASSGFLTKALVGVGAVSTAYSVKSYDKRLYDGFGQLSLSSPKVKVMPFQSSKSLSISGVKTTGYKTKGISRSELASLTKLKVGSPTITNLSLASLSGLKTSSPSVTPSKVTPVAPIPLVPVTPSGGGLIKPPAWPPFKFGFDLIGVAKRGKRAGLIGTPKLGYTPRLKSVLLGEKTRNKSVRRQKLFTPWTERPIVINGKKTRGFKLPKMKRLRL